MKGGRPEQTGGRCQEASHRRRGGPKGGIGRIGPLSPNFYILDGVVPRRKLPEVMAQVNALCERFGFRVGNIFHAGDGNLHPNIMFDELKPGEIGRVLDLGGEIMRVCIDAGGTVTGEHGIGMEKRSYMEWIFSPADLQAMERVKLAFGSGERFNPCKILPGGHGCAAGHAAEVRRHLATPGVYI